MNPINLLFENDNKEQNVFYKIVSSESGYDDKGNYILKETLVRYE
jgi:hypothetical protein